MSEPRPEVSVGQSIPAANLWVKTAERPSPLSTGEIFAGQRVVLFAVPAAFSPACSDVHLPGYLALADDLRDAGADRIACVAVNDAWTMAAWAKSLSVGEHILMLADANRELTAALGMEIDLARFGDGVRSRRYAAIVDDGVVSWLAVERGPGVNVSGAEQALAALASLGPRAPAAG